MVKCWQDQEINVVISKRDVRIKEDTKLLVEEAAKVGPVGGVFHLAAVCINISNYMLVDKKKSGYIS